MGTLYDSDFVEWSARTAELLRERRFEEVDLENLAEEVADLGTSQQHAVVSQMRRMFTHLIKRKIQPERDGASWRGSIVNARAEILHFIDDSPSLRRHLIGARDRMWRRAITDALDETGLTSRAKRFGLPEDCPFTPEDILEADIDTLTAKLG
jgi:hypothetical protein